MISTLAFLSLNLLAVVSGSVDSVFAQTYSGEHAVSLSTSDVFSKWAVFTQQHELHSKAHLLDSTEVQDIDKSKHIDLESFWQQHGSMFGIIPSTEMRLKQARPMTKQGRGLASAPSQVTYNQMVDGVKVFGGDFRVTVGAHGGVVQAHGLPFRQSGQRQYTPSQKDAILAKPVDTALEQTLFRKVEGHLRLLSGLTAGGEQMTVTGMGPDRHVELVWYSPTMTKGHVQEGSWALSYFLRGVHATTSTTGSSGSTTTSSHSTGSSDIKITTSSSTEGASKLPSTMVCDVFVDARTMSVIGFFDKTSRYSTPFTNPLGRDVEVTDEPSAAVVFDSTSTFPTNDEEQDLLITTTMYVSNLMFSISGGEYQTWDKVDRTLNIEYKLSISNAYFDGDEGIHFGTGYITDDVVGHEWGHGYMETATESLYQYQPGAMDEAFADILGESIDILNADTSDADISRSNEYPPVCMTARGGTDSGARWSMGEDVTGGSGGALRDMYAPTCHYDGDSTYSPYYYCGPYDSGGVHWNSGVVNRLYSVLVDGGVYDEVPGSGAGQVAISGIGMTKALNLFWTAYQELTPTAQFFDLAAAMRQSCVLLTGADIYDPNLLTAAFSVSASTITSADCAEVGKALTQSGMDETAVCASEDLARAACSSAALPEDQTANEAYSKYLGEYYYVLFGCASAVEGVTYRVFDRETLGLASDGPLSFNLGCIEFAYLLSGTATYTVTVYIDSTGGAPDFSSMTAVGSSMSGSLTSLSDSGETELVTVSPSSPFTITLPDASATVVVALTVDSISSGGSFHGRGQYNPSAIGTHKETYLSGLCYGDATTIVTSSFSNAAFGTSFMDDYQWYVQVTKSPGTLAPTLETTLAPSLADNGDVFDTFTPQIVEFGKLTTVAGRRNTDEWMGTGVHVCEGANIKAFNVLSMKTLIQSPSSEMMNIVLHVQHRKQTIMREKAFLRLTVLTQDKEEVLHHEQNLFDNSLYLTHFVPPVDMTSNEVNKDLKIGLQVNFFEEEIFPFDMSYSIILEVGVYGADTAADGTMMPRVYDCVVMHDVGATDWDDDDSDDDDSDDDDDTFE